MSYTVVSSLSSIIRNCIPLSAITQAKQTHAQVLVHGLLYNITLQTDLLLVYSRCGFLQYACKVFDRMPERNMHSWNIMIATYTQHSLFQDALNVFDGFLKLGLKPDHYSFPPLLKACAGTGDFLPGVMLHTMVITLGFENYVVVGSSVLDFYSKCGKLNDAKRVFMGLSWKDSIAWNSMISGLGKAGFHVDALNCFRNMLEEGVKMDSMTIPSLLNVCGRLGDIMRGKEIHGQIMKSTILLNDIAIGNSLIDLYSKCGCLDYSIKAFANMNELNLVTWTTMISCYGMHGKGEESLLLFEKMRDFGFEPNCVTLLAILSSCSHSGLIDQGRQFFNSIGLVYGFETSVEHYACMVDLLSRSGCLEEALKLIRNMKMDPTASIWGALLAGCLMHKNVEIGEISASHLFELEPKNSSNYVSLCSIYDSRGMWTGVSRIRSRMRKLGLVKTPGCSWVAIQGEVHTFFQGDLTHPLGQTIYETLDGIFRILTLTEASERETSISQCTN